MKRRTFLKGIIAAPVVTSIWSWDEIFLKDDGKTALDRNPPNPSQALYRNAVSIGPPPVKMRSVERAKLQLMQWILDKRLEKYAKNFRFNYDVGDHGNEVGIGVVVFPTPQTWGMTWGQLLRVMREDGILI